MPQKTFIKQDIFQYRNIGESINMIFTILRAHGFQIIGAMVKISAVLAIAYFLFSYLSQQELMGNLESPSTFAAGGLGSFFTLTQIINVVLSMLFSVLAQMTVYAWLRNAKESSTAPSLNDVWRSVARQIPALLAIGLAVAAFYGIFAAMIVNVGVASAFIFIILLIPFIYLTIRLSLFIPAMMFEDKGVAAINRSWNLLQGEWLSSFLFFIVIGLISYVLMIVVTIPFIIAGGVYAYFQLGEAQEWADVFLSDAYFMATNLSSIVTVFLNSLLIGVGTAVWFGSMVDKKESVYIKKQIAEASEDHSSSEQEGEY